MEIQKNILKNHIRNSALPKDDKEGFISFIEFASTDAMFKLMSLITSSSSKNIGPVWKSIKNKTGLLKNISDAGFLPDEQKKQLKDLVLDIKDSDLKSYSAEGASDIAEKAKKNLNEFLREVKTKTHDYLNKKIMKSDEKKIDDLRKSLGDI